MENEVLHSESSASLLDLLRRSLNDVELFTKGLKARRRLVSCRYVVLACR